MKYSIELFRNLFLATALVFLFTQCNDDDEIGGTADLVGTWDLTAAEVDLEVDGVPLTQFLQTLGLTPQEAEDFANALEDGFVDSDLLITFESDNTYSVEEDGIVVEDGSWELSGDNLRIDPNGDSATNFTVITLNSSTLVVEFEETDVEDGVEVTGKVRYTFAKQ